MHLCLFLFSVELCSCAVASPPDDVVGGGSAHVCITLR